MNSTDYLIEIISKFRKIDNFEEWYAQQTSETIYNLFNQFIYYANRVISENLHIKLENNKLFCDSESLRKYLSSINIHEKEIDTIINGIKYCKRCGNKITMEVYGLYNSICYGCLNEDEKREILNINLGL
jgi:hypothetical protein